MSASTYRLKVQDLCICRSNNEPILKDISFILHEGDQLAIVGPSGSGKTLLGITIAGKSHYSGQIDFGNSEERIVWVEQQHHFKNLSNTSDFYYQQRFNAVDADNAHTVLDYLNGGQAAIDRLNEMNMGYLLAKPLIQLSNGENKKVQLAQALLSNPTVLILDQPFTGLDKETRLYLSQLLTQLAAQGMLLILITQTDEILGCFNRIISLEKEKGAQVCTREEFSKAKILPQQLNCNAKLDYAALQQLTSRTETRSFTNAVLMKNVHVQYGQMKILDGINWEIKNGERWLLSGHNGAGKSTLLSLITADNPQAYANEIYLFDRKRGSGESIWDIKKNIGYLSPELHLFFDNACSSFEAVASGLFDTIGLFRQLSGEQIDLVQSWMNAFNMDKLGRKRLNELSAGEQRIVLLIRALIKNPPLLILDEPCQGLDDETEQEMLSLFNESCLANNKTMIYVTHYRERRPGCVDRFLELGNGRVVGG